jgi:hypothetical protein
VKGGNLLLLKNGTYAISFSYGPNQAPIRLEFRGRAAAILLGRAREAGETEGAKILFESLVTH